MAGRGISRDSLDAIAQGRVWTGEDALKIGLVDVLGGMEDAVKIAADKAGLDGYDLKEYPIEKNPLEELLGTFTGSVKTRMMKEELGPFYNTWEGVKNITSTQGLVARIPFEIITN